MNTVFEETSYSENVLPLLSHLLLMADDYHPYGSSNHALEMYL
jgi:hypothetical protein